MRVHGNNYTQCHLVYCNIIIQTSSSCMVNLWNTDTGTVTVCCNNNIILLLCYVVESSQFTIVGSWVSYIFVATPVDCVYMYNDKLLLCTCSQRTTISGGEHIIMCSRELLCSNKTKHCSTIILYLQDTNLPSL